MLNAILGDVKTGLVGVLRLASQARREARLKSDHRGGRSTAANAQDQRQAEAHGD